MSSPGQRASAELARDPARADALIALAAACTPRTVQRYRRQLERRGVIAPVPSGQRQHAWAAWPSRNPGATARVIAQLAADPSRSTRAIAAAGCSHQTVLVALRGTGGAAGYGDTSTSAGFALWPQTFIQGTAIVLDPAGPLFTAIGAGNLRAYVQGQDDRGGAALSD